MSLVAAELAITTILRNYTGDPPIYEENTPVPTATQGSAWARWSIREADTFSPEVGRDRERRTGTIYFQHFQPENAGTIDAKVFADKIGALLNEKTAGSPAGSILFRRAVCAYVGTTNGLVQHNITIEWQWDGLALNAA